MPNFPNYPLTETWFPQDAFSELTMYHFGRHHCNPNYSVGPLMAWDHFLFHYIIAGKGTLYSTSDNGEVNAYSLSPGQGFMIWPGQMCTYTSDSEEPWEYAWVEFDGTRAKEFMQQTNLQYNHPVYISQDEQAQKSMAEELIWIVHNSHRPAMELMGHFYIFLCNLIQSSAKPEFVLDETHKDSHLQKATDYIRQHYHRDLTIQEIADYCQVHRSYLFQIFTASFGLSPLNFLIRHRIRKAGELLRTTNLSIGEVSAKVGYPNQMNFTRAFKRVTGTTPVKWKKDGKNQI